MANKTIRISNSSWKGTSKKDKVYIDYADYVKVSTGGGNDSIYNYRGWYDTIEAGTGNDTITLYYGKASSVNAGAGNDKVSLYGGSDITVTGGKGNDTVYGNGYKTLYQYAAGDGNDVIFNWSESDTLKITGGKYTKKNSGKDVILTVGSGKITLKGAKGKKLNIDGTLDGKLSIPTNALKYNGHSYYLFNEGMTWEEAKTYCESRGGHLAVINNAAENSKLFNYMKSKGYDSAYFGLSDAIKEGTWTWATGDSSSYRNWASGEPNGGTYENYGMFYYKFTNGTWNDGDFGSEGINTFICEWDTVTTGGGTVILDNVSTGNKININGTTRIISGSTLK